MNSMNDTETLVSFRKKNFAISIAVVLVLVILGFWGVYYYTSVNDNNTVSKETNNEPATVEKVERSLSGKGIEQDKKDALDTAQSILEASAISPDGKTVQERVEALDSGDTSVVDKSLTEKMRFVGEFETDEELKITTYQALVTLSSYTNAEGKVEPVSDTVWQQVHVDEEAGIAYVPISAFYGPGASFSLELVYSDGEWKMAPYSLLDIINLSALLQQQGGTTATTEE